MKKQPPELLAFLQRHEQTVQALALELRQLVLAELAPCHEYIYQMGRRVSLLYGTSERVLKDNICAIVVYPNKVNLGFHFGSELSNRAGLLEGEGKTWRHIGFRAAADFDPAKVRPYLRNARRLSGAPRSRQGSPAVITRVKQKSPASTTASWSRLF
jgi:hypothetical protein